MTVYAKTGGPIALTTPSPSAAKAEGSTPTARVAIPAQLGIDELMQWLTAQLGASDGDIQQQMDAMANSRARSADLAKVKTAMDTMLGADKSDPVNIAGWADTSHLGGPSWCGDAGPELRTKIDALVADAKPNGDGTSSVSRADVKALSDALGDEMNASASSNEMNMIKLQSAISARGQMIQMISNMVASFSETSKAIIGNTRA
jgi:hypothetical protein